MVGWIAFLILWAIQMVIVAKGMEAVRHFQGWAGPAIWVVMIALAGLDAVAGGLEHLVDEGRRGRQSVVR